MTVQHAKTKEWKRNKSRYTEEKNGGGGGGEKWSLVLEYYHISEGFGEQPSAVNSRVLKRNSMLNVLCSSQYEGCILQTLIAALKILKGNLFADFIAHSTLVALMHILSFFRNQESLLASSGLDNV